MANITISVPDNISAELVEAFASVYAWTSDSGLTKTLFAKKKLADHAKDVLKEYRAQQASITARASVDTIDIN